MTKSTLLAILITITAASPSIARAADAQNHEPKPSLLGRYAFTAGETALLTRIYRRFTDIAAEYRSYKDKALAHRSQGIMSPALDKFEKAKTELDYASSSVKKLIENRGSLAGNHEYLVRSAQENLEKRMAEFRAAGAELMQARPAAMAELTAIRRAEVFTRSIAKRTMGVAGTGLLAYSTYRDWLKSSSQSIDAIKSHFSDESAPSTSDSGSAKKAQ